MTCWKSRCLSGSCFIALTSRGKLGKKYSSINRKVFCSLSVPEKLVFKKNKTTLHLLSQETDYYIENDLTSRMVGQCTETIIGVCKQGAHGSCLRFCIIFLNKCIYVIGLRKVYPYHYEFQIFSKARWFGKTLIDAMMSDFRSYPEAEYLKQISSGKITVNGEAVKANYVIKPNDFLSYCIHRHEFPVGNFPIPVIHSSDELLVVDKPPSIPTNPVGRHRHNSLVSILARELMWDDLHIVHRLDTLTSGLLILARNSDMARKFHSMFSSCKIRKTYLCRVKGKFPREKVVCNAPIDALFRKIGIYHVTPTGKPSTTEFYRLGFDGNTSLILCKPLTGRTHQIRIHLQYLGFPIVNDVVYNNSVFGPEIGKFGKTGKTKEQLREDLIQQHLLKIKESQIVQNHDSCNSHEKITTRNTLERYIPWRFPNSLLTDDSTLDNADQLAYLTEMQPQFKYEEIAAGKLHSSKDSSKILIDKECLECYISYRDPVLEDFIMHLHAWQYKGPDFEFQTELPFWINSY